MSKQLWVLDPVHSEVAFKVRHMMITTVTGTFNDCTGNVHADASDFSDAEISFEADVLSINTRNEQRDAHLRSNDFFDAENHQKVNFKSTSFTKKGDTSYALVGDLTLRGVTHSISLKAEFEGVIADPWGQVKAGFSAEGTINRGDFNLNWQASNEAGDVVLSEEVKIVINAQLIKQM